MPEAAISGAHPYVLLDGQDAPEELQRALLRVDVDSTLHLPACATLLLNDPHLTWIDDARLLPGRALRVDVRVGRTSRTLFDGEVVEFEPDFDGPAVRLRVRALDRSHRLARGQRIRAFQSVTDADIVNVIAREAGLRAQTGSTPQVHPHVLQAALSDLEFLRERAARLGFVLYVHGDTLHFGPPPERQDGPELRWGYELLRFTPRLSTLNQPTQLEVRGWDDQRKEAVVGTATPGPSAVGVGERRAGGAVAREAFGVDATDRYRQPVRDAAEADAAAAAHARRAEDRFIEADGACLGDPRVTAGGTVTVSHVGERFGGEYVVSGATHTWEASGRYETTFRVTGRNGTSLLELLREHTRSAPPAGLNVGVVTNISDPLKQGRVKLRLPWLADDAETDWARVVSPGAGASRGLALLPEVNDEVLVAFGQGDVGTPFVLGGLWGGVDAPPDPDAVKSGRVDRRVWRSREGHRVLLDDSDDTPGVLIEDARGSRVHLNARTGDVLIEVAGQLEVRAERDLTLTAGGTLTLRGQGVRIDGTSGNVDVTGVLIRLN